MTESALACVHCGAGPAMQLDGLCMGCLLRTAGRAEHPARIGPYEILEQLGEGGMGVVYRAREPRSGRDVALKAVRGGELAAEASRARFRRDLAFLSQLQHPNIVQVYDAQHINERTPYFTMQFVRGGSLDGVAHRDRFAGPKAAAQLMATLARAVQFCHDAERPLLHRDIKPANILIGPGGHPYLTDFGIAVHLEPAGEAHTKTRAGTLLYMAPEQVSAGPLTKATDVYGLGAVLYELITGRPPFEHENERELLRRIEQDEPAPPHKLVPKLSRDLSDLCLVALAKRPTDRYPSAAALADDLERFLRDEPPLLRPHSHARRALSWVRRHRLVSAGLASTLALFALVAASALWLIDAQERELHQAALASLAYAVRAQAGAVLNELREAAERVERATRDIERGEGDAALIRHAAGFRAMTLFETHGIARARVPAPLDATRSYAFRDYFQGARELASAKERRATLAHAFRSEVYGDFEFALSAPIFDGADVFAGVLLAGLSASSTFGSIYAGHPERAEPLTAVLGPRDRDRPPASGTRPGTGRGPPESLYFLVHPALCQGREVALPPSYAAPIVAAFAPRAPPAERLQAMPSAPVVLDDYRDPLSPTRERWLAAFAPVGRSGYIVLVQIRYRDAVRASITLAARIVRLGSPAAVLLTLLWVAFLLRLRRE